MPSHQKLVLNCNSRWRYKGSKFDRIPYKPFKICSGSFSLEQAQNQRGAVSNFHPLYFGWELQLRGNFWQGPFSKDTLLENGTKSHNFTNLFFCDVTLRYSILMPMFAVKMERNFFVHEKSRINICFSVASFEVW